jgi:hypothetical protein
MAASQYPPAVVATMLARFPMWRDYLLEQVRTAGYSDQARPYIEQTLAFLESPEWEGVPEFISIP